MFNEKLWKPNALTGYTSGHGGFEDRPIVKLLLIVTCYLFQDMEGTFLEAVSHPLGDRFTDATEDNLRKFYQFVTGCMLAELKMESC